jgi:hypothetical protein
MIVNGEHFGVAVVRFAAVVQQAAQLAAFMGGVNAA